MQIRYVCPYWGREGTNASAFFARALDEGYDGVEINLPESDQFTTDFQSSLDNIRRVNENFVFIAQQILSPANESVNEYILRLRLKLQSIVALKPDFINSHTGKDFYSFDDNCRIIEAVETIAYRSGIPILHETHRGRFTFHAASLLQYLVKFPHLKLTGDFSHWCTVSESMLSDQRAILEMIIPHVRHIHARVGFEHGPQVSDPFAPEWKDHVEAFIAWWKKIIRVQFIHDRKFTTITPEFGPVPYMPVLPYSQKPLANQWQINMQMKDMLKRRLAVNVTDTIMIL